MTRTCSYCKKVMGYKCHECNTPLSNPSLEFGYCSGCDDIRGLRDGGTTHGICNECEGKMKEKVR